SKNSRRFFPAASRITGGEILRRSNAPKRSSSSAGRMPSPLASVAELKAHLPGRDTNQRQQQAGKQRKSNYVAGAGAANGSAGDPWTRVSLLLGAQFPRLRYVGLGSLLVPLVFPRLAPVLVGVGAGGVELDRLVEIGDRPVQILLEVVGSAAVVVHRGV